MTQAETPGEALLNAALHLLAARSRGVEELRGRLRKKGFKTREVSNCLTWLQERGLLDDAEFSRALVRDRLNFSPRGASLLKQELSQKGISRSVAEEAVDSVFQEERASESGLADLAARKWIRQQGPRVLEELLQDCFSKERERARRRLYAYLARRGFRGEDVRGGIDSGLDEARKRLSPNT
jgi:regulatory protein